MTAWTRAAVYVADLPREALSQAFRQSGAYTDCYACEVDGEVSLAAFIEAFYTTWLFKTERLILRWLVQRPSTDQQARQLALGARQAFAAWQEEGRTPDQLLMADYTGRTKSWLMVQPLRDNGLARTRLYFGSVVVPESAGETDKNSSRVLMGLHKLYSRLLLGAARSRILAQN